MPPILESGPYSCNVQGPKLNCSPVAPSWIITSHAKQNYDVGDWELLAIKLALEECRHLLEGDGQLHYHLDWSQKRNLTKNC